MRVSPRHARLTRLGPKGLSTSSVLNAGGAVCWDIPCEFKNQATQDSSATEFDTLVFIGTLRHPALAGCPAGSDLTTVAVDTGGALTRMASTFWFSN